MDKFEIACKIRYKLNVNDKIEDILMKLNKQDLIELDRIINNKIVTV